MRAPFSQWANSAFQAGAVGEIGRRIRALPAAIGNGVARLRGKTAAGETAVREGDPSGPGEPGGEDPKLPQTAGHRLEDVNRGLNQPFRDRAAPVDSIEWQRYLNPQVIGALLLVIAAIVVYALPGRGWWPIGGDKAPAAAGEGSSACCVRCDGAFGWPWSLLAQGRL